MSLTLWNSRFSVTLVRQHATILLSSTTKASAVNSSHYILNNFQPQQRRHQTTIMDKGRRTSQQSGRAPGKTLQTARNSIESSTSDTGLNVPPFNHPHCDRQAMYQQPVRKVKPLRGKLASQHSLPSPQTHRKPQGQRSNCNSLYLSLSLSLFYRSNVIPAISYMFFCYHHILSHILDSVCGFFFIYFVFIV